jgi:hypothetical protein
MPESRMPEKDWLRAHGQEYRGQSVEAGYPKQRIRYRKVYLYGRLNSSRRAVSLGSLSKL